MSDILEQSDIEALLNAVETGAVEDPIPHAQIFSRVRSEFENVEIRDYDFKRPERITKDQMRSLQTLHDTFARSFGASLSGFLRTIVEVRVADVEQMTYSEFICALPNPTSFTLISAPPLEGQLCLEISPLIIFPIIDRLLGGAPTQDLFIPQRALTGIETRIAQQILERCVVSLGEAWIDVERIEFNLGETESNPHIVQIVPPNEVVVVIGFEIKMTGREGTMSLCIPFNVIEPLIDKLSSESWFHPPREDTSEHWGDSIARRLDEARLEVHGVLAETSITVGELRSLEVGDVLTTDKPATAPVLVMVGGRRKFLAQIGQHKGHRALRVMRGIAPNERS